MGPLVSRLFLLVKFSISLLKIAFITWEIGGKWGQGRDDSSPLRHLHKLQTRASVSTEMTGYVQSSLKRTWFILLSTQIMKGIKSDAEMGLEMMISVSLYP